MGRVYNSLTMDRELNTPLLEASQNAIEYNMSEDENDVFGPASNHGDYYVDEENIADEGVDVEPEDDDDDDVVFVAEERRPLTPVREEDDNTRDIIPDTPVSARGATNGANADPAVCIEMAAMAAIADVWNNPTIVVDEEDVEQVASPIRKQLKRKNESGEGSTSAKRCSASVKPSVRDEYFIVAFGSPAELAAPPIAHQLCKWTCVHTTDALIQRMLDNPIACYAKVNQHLAYIADNNYLIDIRHLDHRVEAVENRFRARGLNVNTFNGAAKYARLDIILFNQQRTDINLNYIVDGRVKHLSKLPTGNADICYFFSEAIIGADGKTVDDKPDFTIEFNGHKAKVITLYFHDKRYDEAVRLPSFVDHRPQLNRIRSTMLEGLIVSLHNQVYDIIDNDFGLDVELQLLRAECGEDVNFNLDVTVSYFELMAMKLIRFVCVLFGISLKCFFKADSALHYVIEELSSGHVDISEVKRRLLQRHKWPLAFVVPKEHLVIELAVHNTRIFDGHVTFHY